MRFLLLALTLTAVRVVAVSPDTLTPLQVFQRLDSLMDTNDTAGARALCTGTALRLFGFMLEAEQKIDPFLDSTKSRDTVVEQKQAGRWCVLKDVSDAVFRKPVMGMDSLHSVQAVHLYRRPEGWRVAEFEELKGAGAPLVARSGALEAGSVAPDSGLFPVSRRAPEDREATRLRLRVSLRSGDSLPRLPQGPGQKVLRRGRAWAEVETQVPSLPHQRVPIPDSLAVDLASCPYLDLGDSLLQAEAATLRRGAASDSAIASRIYTYVTETFRFRLGASLFGTSRAVMRDMQGDCSEAAVLTAALLRACGIPARVALGFATLRRGVFIGHAWAEAFLDGAWIGVDPALREFPAGANRLMLLRMDGSEDMQVAASNLLIRVLSNLDLQIENAWEGDRTLPLHAHPGNAAEARAFFESVLNGIGK